MTHALLLRLFLSPFFSVHVAIQYLKSYPGNIGITHYLTSRLRQMHSRDVEFYWPQLCHLLVTQPTDSVALECFILERAEESTHSAMLTFWFMQAALCDFALTRTTNPTSFNICQRVLLRCHDIIFGDPPLPILSSTSSEPSSSSFGKRSPYSNDRSSRVSGKHSFKPSRSETMLEKSANAFNVLLGKIGPTNKITPGHIGAAVVGMGIMAASSPGVGTLGLVESVGRVVISQGRVDYQRDSGVKPKFEVLDPNADRDDSESDGLDVEGNGTGLSSELHTAYSNKERESNSSDEELWSGGQTSKTSGPSTPSAASATTPSLPIAPFLLRQNTVDPLDQLSSPSPSSSSSTNTVIPAFFAKGRSSFAPPESSWLPTSMRGQNRHLNPSHSSPSLSSSNRNQSLTTSSHPTGRLSTDVLHSHSSFSASRLSLDPAFVLSTLPKDDQTKLLRSHYCRSEVRFLLTLEEICNRLLVVPKLARVSALRAELTSLNHLLPAEVCMPTWCEADHAHEQGGETSSGNDHSARQDSAPKPKAHHRVVRISPGDSVVLNSAEKAPYLIHVEVLVGDLDFDPEKVKNRDLLKRIVGERIKNQESAYSSGPGGIGMTTKRKEGPQSGLGFGGARLDPLVGIHSGLDRGNGPIQSLASSIPSSESPILNTNLYDASTEAEDESDIAGGFPSRSSLNPTELDRPMDEMDLVEQIYGTELSAKDIDPYLEERMPADLNPRNKAIDLAVWSGLPTDPKLMRRSGSDVTPGTNSPPLPSTLKTGDPSSTAFHLPTRRNLTLDDYSDRMRTAAIMLAQLNANSTRDAAPAPPPPPPPTASSSIDLSLSRQNTNSSTSTGGRNWLPGAKWIASNFPTPNLSSVAPTGTASSGSGVGRQDSPPPAGAPIEQPRKRLPPAEAEAIRERIMAEMLALEEERVDRMTEKAVGSGGSNGIGSIGQPSVGGKMEDEGILKAVLEKADPSAAVFSESWAAKKARIRASSPWGHLASWDVLSVIVKTGADLRQEQLATQLIERFMGIWKEEKSSCWVRYFRILITGDTSGLVETITDSVSVHSIKKAEYGRRVARGSAINHVSLLDHFVNVYGDPSSASFARAQRNFIKSVAGASVVTYLLQIKDRHNGNILIDRDGHCIHIDFGFMLSNSPGNMGFEAAPFKFTTEYLDIMGGIGSPGFALFKKLFKEGFEAARKHSDEIITIVELMQYKSKLPCFEAFGDQTAQHLRERFQLGLTQQAVDDHLEKLIVSSIGSYYTRLYDSFQWLSQSVFQ